MSNGKKERTEDEKVELRGMIVCYTLIHFVVLMVIINYTWNGIVAFTSPDNDKK